MSTEWELAGLFLSWNGFLIAVIKWLLSRELKRFETKINEVDAKGSKALEAVSGQELRVNAAIAALKLDACQNVVCGNHHRMEEDNVKQYELIAKLNGNISRLTGKIDGLVNSMDLLMQHHITRS